MRFEQRAGSEETLLALYDVVAAAEEIDLAEQAQDEAYALPSDESDEIGDGFEASEEDADDADRVTMSQAVGIIEHLLGGRPMRGGGQAAS